MTINQQLQDAFIKRGVRLTRVEQYLANQSASVLQSLSNELSKLLVDVDLETGSLTRKLSRLQSLQKRVNEAIATHYDDLETRTAENGLELAKSEALWLGSTFEAVIGVDLLNINITPEFLKAVTGNAMIEGAASSAWWEKQATELQFKFMQQMRMGIMQGEPLNDLNRRIRGTRESGYTDGIMGGSTKGLRAQAETLARTAALTVCNDTRLAVYRANADVVAKLQWHATLDPRTCKTCGPRDGKTWTLDGEGVLPFATTPLHFRCRCTLLPVTKSWAELVAAAGGDSEFAAKLDKISKATRASMDGQVPESMTWGDWLDGKAQADPATAKEILGAGRFDLWQRGKIGANDLIDDRGRPLNLSEL